ncbi:pyruvate phosphate dikinase protein [Rhizobium phage RHph_Y1_11]|nr:pyruvate phosphate dikinase protein [Rhizobium phage RHph_Y1_11]
MKIHDFGPGITGVVTDKEVVGGKGQSLALMTNMGINVPPGCIIDIPHCTNYWWLEGADQFEFVTQISNDLLDTHLPKLAAHVGWMPLLSVRSGAPVSMPGMMDTILNVGLTSDTLPDWEIRIGERATWDSYRRLILMLSTTAFGLPEKVMNAPLEHMKAKYDCQSDTELELVHLIAICESMKLTFKHHTGKAFPDTLSEQLNAAVEAVFRSWNSERALVYRKINNLEHVSGTAVTVQAMAFGNLNEQSGTGVLFTRNPLTGEKKLYGEFLVNAQGEDVVAGIRTPHDIHEMAKTDVKLWNGVYAEILQVCAQLEDFYKDMVDIEFTVQNGELYILQSRVGKRSAAAALKIAMDLYDEGVIDSDEIFKRITRNQYKVSKRPIVDPSFKKAPAGTGINASPGVVTGTAVFSAEQAVMAREAGKDVILVTKETTPDDIAGMNAAVGILTATGGSTSHAAVVARAMEKPCVCGLTGLTILSNGVASLKLTAEITQGISVETKITICGSSGRVWINEEVPITAGDSGKARKTLLDMVSGDAYQVVNLMELSEDTVPQNIAIRIEHCVMQGLSVDDIVQSIAGLQVLGHNIMLDLGMADLEGTKALRSIFCQDPLPKQHILVLNAILAMPKKGMLDPDKVLISRADKAIADVFVKAGFIINKPAKVIADLMGNHAVEITEDFIKNVVGSKDALDELMKLLEAGGKKPKAATRDIHPERLLFTRLAD